MESHIGLVQYGGEYQPGLLMYRPNLRRQHGHGLGSFFGTMFSRLIPLAKEYLLPHAVTAAKNVASDVVNGVGLKQSLRTNAKGVLKGVANQVFNQKGSGARRGRKRKSHSSHGKSTKKHKPSSFKKSKSRKSKKYSSKKKRQLKKSDFITLFD